MTDVLEIMQHASPEDDEVIRLLKEAVARGMSPQEQHAQMVSFTMAMLPEGCTVTREEVEEMLAKNYWV